MREYKFVVVGTGGVGKSSLTIRFVEGIFDETYIPTIEDYYKKQVDVDNQQYKLEIIDTAGAEQFTAMRDLYMKNGQGFILVYSITTKSSLNDLAYMREEILRIKDQDRVPMILVGNKCDLEDERIVTREEGEQLSKQWNCSWTETSAKAKVNVEHIFFDLIRQLNQSYQVPEPAEKKKKKSACCVL